MEEKTKKVKEKHPIPSEEEINEIKQYWMIHRGHKTSSELASKKVYEDFKECEQDAIKLAISFPNQTFYILQTHSYFINKVKDAVLFTNLI